MPALAAKSPRTGDAGLVNSGGFAQLSEEAFLEIRGGVGPGKDMCSMLQGRIGRHAFRFEENRSGVEAQAFLVMRIEARSNHVS